MGATPALSTSTSGHWLLPDHQAAGEGLPESAEERARARAAVGGARRAVVHLRLNRKPTTDAALLHARRWRWRGATVMIRALSPEADPRPGRPPG
ncbi:hypothetical protein [Streptomyces sp. NPDC006368]|uniref:hypothetical protein n=1 Tax=Streptomyces sp. NPDC006368 TaxID=3156760 RepID=UPI0033A8BD5F